MPEFYVILAQKILFADFFWGGGGGEDVPPPTVSYACGHGQEFKVKTAVLKVCKS